MASLESIGGQHYEIMKRCYNPNSVMWNSYGAMGITVCVHLLYLQGLYNCRAVSTAVDKCLHGKKSKAEYFEEPIRIFPPTKKEKEAEEEKELRKFVAFANGMVADSKK